MAHRVFRKDYVKASRYAAEGTRSDEKMKVKDFEILEKLCFEPTTVGFFKTGVPHLLLRNRWLDK